MASGAETTPKGKIDLSGNNLCGIEPEILAKAVVWFKLVKLLQSFLTKFVPHRLAIIDALGEPHSCVQHLQLDCVHLSAVDVVVFAKEVSKMQYALLSDVELTPQQVRKLSPAIGEDESQLEALDLSDNHLPELEPALLGHAMRFLQILCLHAKGLTKNTLDSIYHDAIRSPIIQIRPQRVDDNVYLIYKDGKGGLRSARRIFVEHK